GPCPVRARGGRGVQPGGGAGGDVLQAGLVRPGEQAPPRVRAAAVGAGGPQVQGAPAVEGRDVGVPAEALVVAVAQSDDPAAPGDAARLGDRRRRMREVNRKSTRLNSSHVSISYAVFCLKQKK